MSGFNNEFPEMRGVLLGLGPSECSLPESAVFRRGFSKGPVDVADLYALFCSLLRLSYCNRSHASVERVSDLLRADDWTVASSGRLTSLYVLLLLRVAFL